MTVTVNQRTRNQRSRRPRPRVELTSELAAYIVMANGAPAEKAAINGTLVRMTTDKITFKTDMRTAPTADERLIVSFATKTGMSMHSVIVVKNVVSESNHTTIEAVFAEPCYDLLDESNLTAGLDVQSNTIVAGLPPDVLDRWVDLGVLQKCLVNRFLGCPKCNCLATFRYGCPACGSMYTAGSRLMHHFACAHVGKVSEFECEGELVCPKCLLRKLVIGADFEFLDGNFQCLDCDWRGTSVGVVGNCLGCELIFPFELTHQRDVNSYYVERLDPVAVIGPA